MASQLEKFDSSKGGKYDPGKVIIFYDNRVFGGFEDKVPWYQRYTLQALSTLKWTSLIEARYLEPGQLRLVWYTHVGNEGSREFPLHKAMVVKEMFDSLSEEGFRPMVLGWSAENPFPMLGGVEPLPPAKKKQPKRAVTYSNSVAGHSAAQGATPHDRIMKIIEHEEEMEAKSRADEIEKSEKDGLMGKV